MSWWAILGIAVGLAMDALAVSIAIGLGLPRVTRRHVFRLGWHFGLFQFLMPILGWAAGKTFAAAISAWDHWIAMGLLGFVGGKMLYEAFAKDEDRPAGDPTRGWSLVTLSVATSIDALAVGLSMALLGVSIWVPCVVIGLVAGVLSAVGVLFGARLGSRLSHWAEVGGGVVLILIGLRIFLSHVLN